MFRNEEFGGAVQVMLFCVVLVSRTPGSVLTTHMETDTRLTKSLLPKARFPMDMQTFSNNNIL